jgi:hypothetical protein
MGMKITHMKARKTIALHQVAKLDLSFGDLPTDLGFTKPKGFDAESLPWAIPSGSVEEAYCAYLFNRIPGTERTAWMAELWRVLVPNGKCTIIVPYWSSPRSIQDPCSAWPPIVEQSFLYFNKNFREQNKLSVIENCDFDFVYGYTLDQETAGKSDDARPFWIKHYVNAVSDLQVTLTKRPK